MQFLTSELGGKGDKQGESRGVFVSVFVSVSEQGDREASQPAGFTCFCGVSGSRRLRMREGTV